MTEDMTARSDQIAQAQADDAPLPPPDDTPPHTPSPPLSPDAASPWWTAPAGRPVNIPAFASGILALRELFFPQLQAQPVKIKVPR